MIHLYKSVNIIFLYADFSLKSENYHAGNLNKTYLVLHNLQGQFSGTQVFNSALKCAIDSIALYAFGTRSHNNFVAHQIKCYCECYPEELFVFYF